MSSELLATTAEFNSVNPHEVIMSTRTITALYDTRAAADDAKQRLTTTGISQGSIEIHDEGSLSASPAAGDQRDAGVLGGLKHLFGYHEDAHAYAEG